MSLFAFAFLGCLPLASHGGAFSTMLANRGGASVPLPLVRDEVADRIAELGTENFEQAVTALVALGKPAVVPLVETLRTAELDVAWQAARALRGLGENASASKAKLTILVGDESVGAGRRAVACFALGGLGSAASSAAPKLVERLSGEASDLQLLSAIALIEIGKPAVSPLGKSVKDPQDLFASAWSLAVLAHLGDQATRAGPSLKKVVESKAWGREAPFFALRRATRELVLELGVACSPAMETSELLNQLNELEDVKIPRSYRGGRLDPQLLEDGSRLRRILGSAFGMSEDETVLPIDLPKRFEDFDGDEQITAGELIQALVKHLVDSLGPLARDVSKGGVATHGDWQRRAAPLVGLSVALHALSTPEFLGKSHALRVVMGGWEGLYPSDATMIFFADE